MGDDQKIHITIQKGKTLPDLEQCRTCCTNYHCPFCSSNLFKPSALNKCKTHLSLHFHRAVFHEGYTIHRCGLGCRQHLHFHCPYCESTLLRKSDTIKHLHLCKESGDPHLLDTTANAPDLETTPQTLATSTALSPVTTPSHPVKHILKKICPICQAVISKKNFKKHIERKHSSKLKDLMSTSHLDSKCNNPENGLLTVKRSCSGNSTLLDVQSQLWGENQHVFYESTEIQVTMDPELKIGFIGAGNMAYGIAKGILPGNVLSENVKVSAPSSRNLERFQELGIAVTHSNVEVVSGSDVVFIAVKPHLVPLVLVEISEHITDRQIVVSVAAGVSLVTLEELLPQNVAIIRLMPNLPCVVQEGALLFARGTHAKPEHGALLRSLLHCCGLVEEGPEAWIDIHTGLSGSGVAFVYLFAEALADGAVKMGMPSALAQRIASQTVLGAGMLLRDSGQHPAQLRSEVCTPGGTTIHGLHTLEQGGVRASVMSAVESATTRARVFGQRSAEWNRK